MTRVKPLNVYKISEVLFDFSESIPNDKYLALMKLLKERHELRRCDADIVTLINTLDEPVQTALAKYIREPQPCISKRVLYVLYSVFLCGVGLWAVFFVIFYFKH